MDISEKIKKACDLLEQLGIEYTKAEHPPAMTMEDCKIPEDILGAPVCKNLFLCNAGKTDFYLLMLGGDIRFKTKYLSRQIGSSRLSFADEDKLDEILGLTPGSITFLGLMNDKKKRVRLIIDKSVLQNEYVCVHPCSNTATVKIKVSDITDKFLRYTGHSHTVVDLKAEENNEP
ncbi:MAG: prolyl-tRNA synthetase associated domain-containing protein [Clostridiales bacterium]|nr:prolyl-tRNA synthetase associated domain-containing protein [Clostridiales bacterium]